MTKGVNMENKELAKNYINMTLAKSKPHPVKLEVVKKKVQDFLPEIQEKASYFRSNSQSTISLQTLTMLNGQSPLRMLRQIAAEVDKKKRALLEAQISFKKKQKKLEKAKNKNNHELASILSLQLEDFEQSIHNAMKDIAVLSDRYNEIKSKNNIDDWTEADFEEEERSFHVRRGFELGYQQIMQNGRLGKDIIEYLQQYGVHPQVASREIVGYYQKVEAGITEGIYPDSGHLEDWLDAMKEKYKGCVQKVTQRLFGKDSIVSVDNTIPRIERR